MLLGKIDDPTLIHVDIEDYDLKVISSSLGVDKSCKNSAKWMVLFRQHDT